MCARIATLLTTVVAAYASTSATLGTAQAVSVEEICTGKALPFESPPFERFDRNDDNRLTPREVAECPALEAVYESLDLNADQTLTRVEYRSFADVWRLRARALGDDALD